MHFTALDDGTRLESINCKTTLALGTFDGVHAGHKRILENALNGTKLPLCVFTFSENPFGVPCITSLEEKLQLFHEYGASYAFVCDFSKICNMTPKEFINGIVLEKCHAEKISYGFNYRFGRNAEGTPSFMEKSVSGKAECVCAEPYKIGDEIVSSTKIRSYLANGDIEGASKLLGRQYSISAKVVHGNEIGRALNFPTLNFEVQKSLLLPQNGVYITKYENHPCITNIGTRPTVSGDKITVETHIIDCDGDFYGKSVKIDFFCKIRDELKFDSLSILAEQIEKDKKAALDYFNSINVT